VSSQEKKKLHSIQHLSSFQIYTRCEPSEKRLLAFLYHEDRGIMSHKNAGIYLTECTVPYDPAHTSSLRCFRVSVERNAL